MGSTAGNTNPELGSSSATVPLRLHANNAATGSPQPSPLSQSVSVEGTTNDALSTASRIDAELPQQALDPSDEDERIEQPSDDDYKTPENAVSDRGNQGADSPTITVQDQGHDPRSGATGSGHSGDNSPDARLEKEYHKEKVRKDGTKHDDEAKGGSSEDDSGLRGRHRSREKKQYRIESNASASDTDGGSAIRADASGSKKAPPRKLKTFEPLREKEESTSSPRYLPF